MATTIRVKEDEVLRVLADIGPTLSKEFMECLVECLPKAYDGQGNFDPEKYRSEVDACVRAKMPERVVFLAGMVVGMVVMALILR